MGWRCALLAASLLTGCALGGTPAPRSAIHDLDGVPVAAFNSTVLRHIEVRGPSWLNGPAMAYRLRYQASSERRVYALNRWAAPPPELVQQALGRGLGSARGQPGACSLKVGLEEFIQEFDAPEQSRVVLQAQLTLLGPDGLQLARRREALAAPAAPDPAGGVAGYRQVVAELAGRVDGWLGSLEQAGQPDLDLKARCGP
ncbi:MAG: ABC-type transport auxiliary lipoprotein family protein [Rhodocyclaceae bacterium]|jgi:cholesterol transport system auxiliary component|nr:ABC-type transport auxiliary lipoprotein family protein [Rhodocyclaceae bacterium]